MTARPEQTVVRLAGLAGVLGALLWTTGDALIVDT